MKRQQVTKFIAALGTAGELITVILVMEKQEQQAIKSEAIAFYFIKSQYLNFFKDNST